MELIYAILLYVGIVLMSFQVQANTLRYPNGDLGHCGNITRVLRGQHEEWLPLKLQVALDPTFDEEQQRILFGALKLFLQRGSKKSILDCAYRNSSKDLPESREKFESQLISALSVFQVNDVYLPAFAFVARYWNDPKSVGLGYVGLFYDDDKPMPGFRYRHYLHVAINSDHLGSNAPYFLRSDEAYWAGVLGHEFLHNLGYAHPKGYEGSFISEYGHCVHRNGADGAPLAGELPDREVEKEM